MAQLEMIDLPPCDFSLLVSGLIRTPTRTCDDTDDVAGDDIDPDIEDDIVLAVVSVNMDADMLLVGYSSI